MDFSIPEEIRLLRTTVRRFVQEKLLPLEQTLPESHDIDPELRQSLIAEAKRIGLWGLNVPEEYGGGGLGHVPMVFVYEELAKSTVPPFRTPSVLFPNVGPVLYSLKGEQFEYFTRPIIEGRHRTCYAMTEPHGGSDPGSMQTRAVRRGDKWYITGRKIFVSNADKANVIQVFAVTDPEKRQRGGITCFLVEPGMKGFSLGQQFHMMSPDAPWELVFDECEVDDFHVAGEVGQGFVLAQKLLGEGRLFHGARAVGAAMRALKMGVEFAKQRSTFGVPLADRQIIQWWLAEAALNIHAARLITLHAAWRADQGKDVRVDASMAKLQGVNALWFTIDKVMQIHGGMGLSKELIIERMFRDARSRRFGEGTDEIHTWNIARNLLRDPDLLDTIMFG